MKDKKNVRQRGNTTHGWGSMKKHRGAGNRGGRGMAGTGKRGDANKPKIWKNKKYFGAYGFTSRKTKLNTVNTTYLESRAETFIMKGQAKAEEGFCVINLGSLGYDKLLSKGRVTKKYKVTIDYATPKAIEKIKKAGGKVTVKNVPMEDNTRQPA